LNPRPQSTAPATAPASANTRPVTLWLIPGVYFLFVAAEFVVLSLTEVAPQI
jgi:hypothetical protein